MEMKKRFIDSIAQMASYELKSFDVMGMFVDHNVQPSFIEYEKPVYYSYIMDKLNEIASHNTLQYTYSSKERYSKKFQYSYSYSFLTNEYKKLIVVNFLSSQKIKTIDLENPYDQNEDKNIICYNGVEVYYDPSLSKETYENILNILDSSRAKFKEEEIDESVGYLTMIMHNSQNGFYTKTFKMETWKYDYKDLTLHYGSKMETFHKTLVNKVEKLHKGVVLFHGDPGTGKTHYIRRLTRDLNAAGKTVIFIPNSVFELIGNPNFQEFMLENFSESAGEIVFILEDAEKILMKTKNGRSEQVSTLLNLGDGIMNDLFKIQLICTFNCEETQIDEAILRDGRLIAKRFFGKLSIEDSQNLVNSLNIDFTVVEPMTLASIFALQDKDANDILIEK